VTPRGAQTIAFANPGTQNFGTTPTLGATATSGLAVSFSSATTGVCTITSGGTLTFLVAGTCTIDADQAGDATYLPAPTVSQSFAVTPVAPGAPVIATATAGNGQATVSFGAPASSGGATITSYTVTSSPGGLTATGAAGPITVAGLNNGTAYTFTVTATNSAGTGAASAPSNSVIPSPAITLLPAALPNATTGGLYGAVFLASGGTGPYTFAVTSGALPAGLALASGGTLFGLPTAGGSFTFSITATDTSGFTGVQSYTLTVDPATIVVAPTSLAAATVAGAYNASVSASGGTAPYTFAVSAGALPAGLSLAGDGTLSGTPTAGGSFNFTVTATDSSTGGGPYTGSRAYSLSVGGPTIAVAPASLPATTAGSGYSQVLTASGCTAPYSFAVTLGALPAGLTLASDGTLSGTPSVSGAFAFTVTATDSSTGAGPYTATRGYTLTIGAPTITLAPATLPAATVGAAFSANFSASGGSAPYAYAVSAGALPAGMTLSSDGTLSGTPTAGGSFNATITVTDALGFGASGAYTLAVAAPVLSVGPATLPGATAGTAYAQQLTASGGTAPYTFALSAGTLPAGLALAADGSLSGTPKASGTFAFSVTATDASTGSGPYSATRAYTLAVAADPPVAVPDSATALAGTAVDIAVTANDSGRIDSISLATTPQHGSATVDGLVVRYAPAAGFAGEDSFAYVATGPGGTSAPATVAVTVHPVPVAVSRTAQAIAGVETSVDLADGASGGPFTGATLVALAPANAGVATVAAEGGTWVLRFTPDPAFGGEATARFTLDNAYATSAEAVITFQVQARPDPTRDAQVRGLVDAQVESTRRFAQAQLGNFRQRLEQLHGAGRHGGRFANGVTFTERQCAQATDHAAREACLHRGDAAQERARGAGGPSDMDVAQADAGSGGDKTQAVFGVWAGGMIRSGSFDGRGGSGTGFESDGLSVGVDFDLSPSFTLGAGLGYGRDDNRVGDAGSRLEGSARAFVAYASYHPWQHLFVDATLGYQQLDYDATRRLAGDAGTVRGRRDGDQWFASLAVGTDLQDGPLQFTPYARLDVARGSLDAYTESGHPFLALRYGAMDIDSTVGNLGLRLDYRRRAGWGWFTPQLRLEYQREFADAEASLIRYADLANGPVYTLTPSVFDRNRVVFGLGATLDSDGGWSTRIEYQAQAGGQRDEGVQVNLQKDF
ncbi:MAG TPA: putative Ig domain-containing protein, partial [Xanthomonadaceae bacterium]|nr:putative Ig domain-containing protein [Xanthomonadaceae bacterium]